MDNIPRYGFRPFGKRFEDLQVDKLLIVSGQTFDVNGGASNISLRPGDLVYPIASGGWALAGGTEEANGATVSASHVICGISWQWDATTGKMELKHGLADAVAYSTNLTRTSWVFGIPVEACQWSVDVDDAATATTEAGYRALINDNVDHHLCGESGDAYAYPRLDISGATTTNTLKWRIRGIDPTRENRDFAGAYVKLIVEANVVARPAFGGTTGV
jgi:hypothetical protein